MSHSNSATPALYVAGQYSPDQSVGYLMRKVLSSILAQADTRLAALDRLETKGLVVRERSTEDRRVVHLRLTDDVFLASAGVFLSLIGLIRLTRRPSSMAGAGAVPDAGGAH